MNKTRLASNCHRSSRSAEKRGGSDDAWDAYAELAEKHRALVADWNKHVATFIRMYGKKREPGRPLAASEDQIATVLGLRKQKMSLRTIVAETNLGIRTVRTIIEKEAGKDRASQRHKELRRQTFDKLRAARYRAKIKMRDEYLPKRLAAIQENHAALVKAAKGLGKR